mgnify:CR=1 FL=1
MCKTKYEFDADVKERLKEELRKWQFHMHSTHGIPLDLLQEMLNKHQKKYEKTN